MRYFLCILFCWVFVGANAQTRIAGYEHWFNNDFAARVKANVEQSVHVSLNLTIPTQELPTGIHAFNIRFFDTRGHYSSTQSQFFFKSPGSSISERRIVAYEYWIDGDFANAVSGGSPPQGQLILNDLIDLASISYGMHSFNMRFKDNSKLWSVPISQFFYKTPQTFSKEREIIACQYWVNNDFANAVTVGTTGQKILLLDQMIGFNHLTTGIHSFSIRFMDNSKTWSVPLVQFFYKIPQQDVTDRKIVAYQYWVGNNFNSAMLVEVNPQQQLVISEPINLQNLGTGMHAFNIRAKDNSGLWSPILSQFVYRIPLLEGLEDIMIAGYRYWIDHDIESAKHVELAQPVQELDLIRDIDLSRVPKGERTIHFQFRDIRGFWSLVTSDVFIKHSLPIADFGYEIRQHCDSTSVSFMDLSVDGEKFLWDFGDGKTSNAPEPVHVFHSGGTYKVSLTVTDILLGTDSTLTKNIFVPVKTIEKGVNRDGIVLTAKAVNATYQWLDCNNGMKAIPGATSATFTPASNGSFAVEINQDGCRAVSQCFPVTTVNIPDLVSSGKIKLYPNPTSGQINIDLGEFRKDLRITIIDQFGKILHETKSDYGREFSFNLNQAPGIYFVRIFAENEYYSLRFIIK